MGAARRALEVEQRAIEATAARPNAANSVSWLGRLGHVGRAVGIVGDRRVAGGCIKVDFNCAKIPAD